MTISRGDTLIKVVYDERFKNIPKILETPYVGDYAPYKKEIEMIRNKEFNPNLKEEILKKLLEETIVQNWMKEHKQSEAFVERHCYKFKDYVEAKKLCEN